MTLAPVTMDLRPGPVCSVCPLRPGCGKICEVIEGLLPSPERGRVDPEDLPRLYLGMQLTRALLDNTHLLTQRQQQVVQLYYRESLQQYEIAEKLKVTQQAVNDSLKRARLAVGNFLKDGGDPATSPANNSSAGGVDSEQGPSLE